VPYKDPEKRKQYHKDYHKDWYQRNKDKHKKRCAERRREKRREWKEWKATQKCSHCGEDHPATIDFHHIDKTDKRSVYKLAANGCFTEAKKEAETKCIPLCANCHRKVHWEEKKAKKASRKAKKAAKKAANR
jgi:hypothetical protein